MNETERDDGLGQRERKRESKERRGMSQRGIEGGEGGEREREREEGRERKEGMGTESKGGRGRDGPCRRGREEGRGMLPRLHLLCTCTCTQHPHLTPSRTCTLTCTSGWCM